MTPLVRAMRGDATRSGSLRPGGLNVAAKGFRTICNEGDVKRTILALLFVALLFLDPKLGFAQSGLIAGQVVKVDQIAIPISYVCRTGESAARR
jgi:hypothetical protein